MRKTRTFIPCRICGSEHRNPMSSSLCEMCGPKVAEANRLHEPEDLNDMSRRDAMEIRIEELEAEITMLKTSGIIEVAVRNPNVMEYMQHWEGRALSAEAKLEKLEETVRIQSELIRYACGGVQSRINICLDRIAAELKGNNNV